MYLWQVPGVLLEVLDVEHGLRVGQVWKVNGQTRVYAVARPKVWNPARHRDLPVYGRDNVSVLLLLKHCLQTTYSRSSENHDLAATLDESHNVLDSVHVAQLVSLWRLRQNVQDDLPQSQLERWNKREGNGTCTYSSTSKK